MEIQTPLTLFNGFDRSGPVDETVVSETDCGDYYQTQVYFNGAETRDGITRIYAVLYRPKKSGAIPCVLTFDEAKQSLGLCHVKVLLDEGFAVLSVDCCGKTADRQRYTLYPDSLEECINSTGLSSDLRKSALYITGCVGLKAYNYILSKNYIDKDNIGVLGVGEMSSVVWVLALREKLKAGMTMYGGGFLPDYFRNDPMYLIHKAALDVRSCAPYTSLPVLIQTASNESNNSLTYLNELYDCSTKSYFSIGERANRATITAQKKNLKYWFGYMLGGSGYLPAAPELSARESEGKLCYDINIDASKEVVAVNLFTAQGDVEPAFRNWSDNKLEKVSDGKYIAQVDVYVKGEPVYAFATVKYRHSLYISSSLIMKIPSQMKINAEQARSRLIYNNEMGCDDFLVPNDYDLSYDVEKLTIEKGPYDINGICSRTGQLATYKLGDVKYRGEGDELLQIMLYVEQPSNITFTVMNKNKDLFSCVKEFRPDNGWTTVSLSPFEFKSQKAVLSDWKNITAITISADDAKLLVSSMLWV